MYKKVWVIDRPAVVMLKETDHWIETTTHTKRAGVAFNSYYEFPIRQNRDKQRCVH